MKDENISLIYRVCLKQYRYFFIYHSFWQQTNWSYIKGVCYCCYGDLQLLSQPADNTVFASCAFSSTAPQVWNRLPLTIQTVPIQTVPSVNTFRCHLKTYPFSNNTISMATRVYSSNLFHRHVVHYKIQMLLTYLHVSAVLLTAA